MLTISSQGKYRNFQFRQQFSEAFESDIARFEKSALASSGMAETPHLGSMASHLGMTHVRTHVNRMGDESVGSEVHHVFTAPESQSAVGNLMNHWRDQGMSPTYLGRNSQGFHVVGATDHLGRGTYAHIGQTPVRDPRVNTRLSSPALKNTSIALTGGRGIVDKLRGAVNDFKAGFQQARSDKSSAPSYPNDAGSDIHSIAAAHGIASYDTRGKWQHGVNGNSVATAHFSHLMTANNPQAQINRLRQTIAQSHPTTAVKYNRVRVGAVTKHVYSFQHHDGKALHTVTVTKPALEQPGGKMEWQ